MTSSNPGIAPNERCFAVPGRLCPEMLATGLTPALDCRSSDALAQLLPLLGCGEEAAALAFDALANHYGGEPTITAALSHIASDERMHDAMIGQLRRSLPPVPTDPETLGDARRFHIGMARGGTAIHLARIAALDSGLCLVLGRLLRRGLPLGADQACAAVLLRIREDEARHVRVSRNLALTLGATTPMRDAAVAARDAFVFVLAGAAHAFEALGVDPASLDRDLRRLPNGLLAA